MKVIDANYVLRYLLRDVVAHHDKAKAIIEKENIYLPDLILAEVVYVLEKVYEVSRNEITSSLQKLIDFPNIKISDKSLLRESLVVYVNKNIDYADAYLLAYNTIYKAEVYSFDKRVNKFLK